MNGLLIRCHQADYQWMCRHRVTSDRLPMDVSSCRSLRTKDAEYGGSDTQTRTITQHNASWRLRIERGRKQGNKISGVFGLISGILRKAAFLGRQGPTWRFGLVCGREPLLSGLIFAPEYVSARSFSGRIQRITFT